MRGVLTAVFVLLAGGFAAADDVVCINGRCPILPRLRSAATTVVVEHHAAPATEEFVIAAPAVTVVAPAARRVTVGTSAQAWADECAATGRFVHCTHRGGGGYEGIGWSSASPEAAKRACCYWGRRPLREVATAWCPTRRMWFAVARYD